MQCTMALLRFFDIPSIQVEEFMIILHSNQYYVKSFLITNQITHINM